MARRPPQASGLKPQASPRYGGLETHAEHGAWLRRFTQGEREREPHEKKWLELKKAMAGPNFRQGYGDKPSPVNQPNSFMRVVLPHLLPRDRRLEVEVTAQQPGPDYEQSAEQLGDILTSVCASIRLLSEARRMARSSFYSAGILKAGLEVRTGIIERVASDARPDVKVGVDLDLERAEHREFLDAGLPYVCWVPARRFYPDPQGNFLSECGWVAHRFFRKLESLKVDPRFKALIDELRPISRADARDAADRRETREKDPLYSLVELFEVYDRDARCVWTIPGPSAGCREMLEPQPWPAVEGFPFSMVIYEEVEDYFWPNPPLSPTFDAMSGTDDVTQHMVEQACKSGIVHGYDPQAVTDAQTIPFERAPDGSIVPIPGLAQGAWQKIDRGGIHPDQWRMAGLLKQTGDEMKIGRASCRERG